jgi:uncharacterized protein with von Willebrand factor type A (vWA) domain
VTRAWRYSRWDGTQVGFDLDADELLRDLGDDLLYHGDLDAALRRLMQGGMRRPDGQQLRGLREIMDQLRRERQERLDRYDLGGAFSEIADELREVVDLERRTLDDLEARAHRSGDPRRIETTDATVADRRMELEFLPPDLAGQVKALTDYDFVSSEAQQRFEDLVEKLRQELAQRYFDQASQAMANMSPEQMQRMKDMLAELNHMLEQRARGEEPDFDGFMERYGDFFPENPQNLDELLEALARRMAAAQAMLASMSPEQRAQLQSLSQQLLDDMDLRWQMDQLSSHLQQMYPDAGWERGYSFSGTDPLGFAEAARVMEELGDIDRLEELLARAASPAELSEVDLERAADLLGDDAAADLDRLRRLAQTLEEAGLIEQKEGRLQLTPRGLRRIGEHALGDLFQRLDAERLGRHDVTHQGTGHERAYDPKPFEWGDPFLLDIERTVRNAVSRSGKGTPVRLEPGDFEIDRTESLTRTSTMLLVDLSLSMPMRGNFLPAKKVAMALHTLISGRYPRDHLGMIGFSNLAYPIAPEDLPEVSWDFVYGTNMQHALLLARKELAHRPGTKQVIMITDGEPTAHLIPGRDEPYFEYPPAPETLEATLKEVARCTKAGIRINAFVLDATPSLQRFIEQMTRMNRGRAFFATPDTLGDYVLVDFLEQKRATRRARPA